MWFFMGGGDMICIVSCDIVDYVDLFLCFEVGIFGIVN